MNSIAKNTIVFFFIGLARVYPGLVALRVGDRSARVQCVDLGQPLPTDLDDVHGVVSLGGPQSANDSDAWVAQELALLRDAHAAGIPILGICLGHQMLALALGAKTKKMPQGHHGANHPVKDFTTGKVEIVSMNHGFTVDIDTGR